MINRMIHKQLSLPPKVLPKQPISPPPFQSCWKNCDLCPSLRRAMTVTYKEYAPAIPHLEPNKFHQFFCALTSSKGKFSAHSNFQSCLKIQQSVPLSSTRQDSHVQGVRSRLTKPRPKAISSNFLRTQIYNNLSVNHGVSKGALAPFGRIHPERVERTARGRRSRVSKYACGIFVAENEVRQHRLLGNAERFFVRSWNGGRQRNIDIIRQPLRETRESPLQFTKSGIR